jgi:hypothetical protein
MSENKVKYANFPERELKVVIGANLNANTIKALSRLSIGTYEMSFMQQERGANTSAAAKSAMNQLAGAMALTVSAQKHRDYCCWLTADNAEHRFQLWVTTPFELTQSGHIVWCKYQELGGEGKVGVSFRLSTGFVSDDILHLLKHAQSTAVKLAADEPFLLKGNPPPRFAKKKAAATTPATAPAPASTDTPAPADAPVSTDTPVSADAPLAIDPVAAEPAAPAEAAPPPAPGT